MRWIRRPSFPALPREAFRPSLSLSSTPEKFPRENRPSCNCSSDFRSSTTPPVAAMASPSLIEGEWEVCNDNGFVYKRRKQDPAVVVPPAPSVDPAAEARLRKSVKKKALLRLKEKYSREIEQWEQLYQTLQETRKKSECSSVDRRRIEFSSPEFWPDSSSGSDTCKSLIADLLFQVEAQESILEDVAGLCATAEAICDAQVESIRKSLFELPVWESPRSIMNGLCALDAGDARNG